MGKKKITNPALMSWAALNEALNDADEKLCKNLIDDELRGRKRPSFVLRIHSRLNTERRERERQEYLKLCKVGRQQ